MSIKPIKPILKLHTMGKPSQHKKQYNTRSKSKKNTKNEVAFKRVGCILRKKIDGVSFDRHLDGRCKHNLRPNITRTEPNGTTKRATVKNGDIDGVEYKDIIECTACNKRKNKSQFENHALNPIDRLTTVFNNICRDCQPTKYTEDDYNVDGFVIPDTNVTVGRTHDFEWTSDDDCEYMDEDECEYMDEDNDDNCHEDDEDTI